MDCCCLCCCLHPCCSCCCCSLLPGFGRSSSNSSCWVWGKWGGLLGWLPVLGPHAAEARDAAVGVMVTPHRRRTLLRHTTASAPAAVRLLAFDPIVHHSSGCRGTTAAVSLCQSAVDRCAIFEPLTLVPPPRSKYRRPHPDPCSSRQIGLASLFDKLTGSHCHCTLYPAGRLL